jgi:serine/threonine-protein kinase
MTVCNQCRQPLEGGARYCSACGAQVVLSTAAPTQTSAPLRTDSSDRESPGSTEGRFVPGDIVAGRYRIVGPIGRGGMGEVYRADDLKLGQPVALKFLPESLESDVSRLRRFFNEVKTARQVSHPNVCRVYDVGEVDGQHFLSMEYVDGENLASLIRRIGRLEHEKGVQIARQICAGLAAIHGRGIVHRDLKPANVMVDGHGQARITDFGLAHPSETAAADDVLAGTPDYMAPEQLEGRDVTVRSDLYALGQVLYEVFSGRPAFRSDTLVGLRSMKNSGTPTSLSSLVSSIDPAVERVVDRCLSVNPDDRPSSALAVSAALPGGNPLAAALAAGETPSPEMVAAAGPDGGLRPAVGLTLFLLFVVGLLGLAALLPRMTLYGVVPLDRSMVFLENRARSVVERLGYTEAPVDSSVGWMMNTRDLHRSAGRDPSSGNGGDDAGWSSLREPGQRALFVRYRQSDRPLVPSNILGRVSTNDPAPQAGDVTVSLDLSGRLLQFEAMAPELGPPGGGAAATDWTVPFELAGLDLGAFRPLEPTVQPQLYHDTRLAWVGPAADDGRELRVEAASAGGRPVYFQSIRPEDPLWSAETTEPDSGAAYAPMVGFLLVVLIVLVSGAVILASFNWRRGRGDRRGAARLAIFVFSMRLLLWIATGHHVVDPVGQTVMLLSALGQACLLGTVTWLLYLALEPYVRRLWPESIVAWTRLMSGGLRDPLVGRDLLIGLCGGVALAYLGIGGHHVSALVGVPNLPPLPWGLSGIAGGRWALGGIFSVALSSLAAPLAYTMLVLILRIVFRVQWLAAAAFCLLFSVMSVLEFVAFGAARISPTVVLVSLLLGVATGLLMIVLLLRFGLLATVGAFFVAQTLAYYPITLDPGAPYFATSLLGLLVCIALAGFAFYGSLAGRPIFEELVPATR